MITLPPLPSPTAHLVTSDGRMDPLWYTYFSALQRALSEQQIVTLSKTEYSSLANGETVRWSIAQKVFEAGV